MKHAAIFNRRFWLLTVMCKSVIHLATSVAVIRAQRLVYPTTSKTSTVAISYCSGGGNLPNKKGKEKQR